MTNKKHSCGAVLYTFVKKDLYIVLGQEGHDYFHFKGGRKPNETSEQAAIREVKEETCNVVNVKSINLNYHFSTKRKHYHIGLVKVKNNIIDNFDKNISGQWKELTKEYKEKDNLKMFKFDDITLFNLHEVTIKPIMFYYKILKKIQEEYRIRKDRKQKKLDNIKLIK